MSRERKSPWNTPQDIEKGTDNEGGVTTITDTLE